MTPIVATLLLASFVSSSVSPVVPPRVSYLIDARLDPTAGVLEGKETLSFRNTTGLALQRLVLDWPPSVVRGFRVSVKGAVLDPVPGSSVSVFDLPQELRPGASLELVISFRALFSLGNKDRAVRLTTWHPRLSWDQPSHDDYDVKLDVPGRYALAASGRRDSRSGHWLGKGLRNFAVFMGEGYEVAEAMADGGLVWQGHLLDLLGRREEALQSYRWALLLAGNLRMQHDQWGMVIDRKWVEERLKTPFTRK